MEYVYIYMIYNTFREYWREYEPERVNPFLILNTTQKTTVE